MSDLLCNHDVFVFVGNASASDKDDFLDELQTMVSLGYHPNNCLSVWSLSAWTYSLLFIFTF